LPPPSDGMPNPVDRRSDAYASSQGRAHDVRFRLFDDMG
jgi:hypothetical protein